MKLFAIISALLASVVVAHEAAPGLDNINLAAYAGPQLLPRGGVEGQEVEPAEEKTKRGLIRDGLKQDFKTLYWNFVDRTQRKIKNHYLEKDRKYYAEKQKKEKAGAED